MLISFGSRCFLFSLYGTPRRSSGTKKKKDVLPRWSELEVTRSRGKREENLFNKGYLLLLLLVTTGKS